MSVYLYGIVAGEHPAKVDGLLGVGEPPGPVRVVDAGSLRVVVSDVHDGVRAKRRDLAAHTEVLDSLCEQGAALPMRFGALAADDAVVAAEVAARQDRYAELLAELRGRVEMYLKVAHRQDALLRVVLARDEGLRTLNEDLRQRDGGSPEERVRFGELVATAVAERERADAEVIAAAVGPYAVWESAGPAVDGCFVATSYLVERDGVPAFQAAVGQLRDTVGELAEVWLHGPLPPYSFSVEHAEG